MKTSKKRNVTKLTLFAGATALAALAPQANAQVTDDSLINKLEQKGILTADEAKDLRLEDATSKTNLINSVSASKFKLADSIKSMQLFGDLRFRYEYRGVNNPSGTPDTYSKERFRYAFRVGIRGDLFDDFSYGLRVETSNNPRSPWATFGNNTTGGSVTPSDKNSSGIYLGQAYLNWHPEDWYEMTVGRMPLPLYATPMVWDADINPEGAFEKIKYSIDNVDLFAGFGQFDYQNPASTDNGLSGDTFLLAWQVGGNVKFNKNMSFKMAPVLYTYTSGGSSAPLDNSFVGQGNAAGGNPGVPGSGYQAAYNEVGINNLLILEIPLEFNFRINSTPLGDLQARIFGDYAHNFQGDSRANAAYAAGGGAAGAFPGVSSPVHGQDNAFQAGFGIGSAGPVYGPTQGLVYGSTSQKGTWESRVYYQYIQQYALDVNLIDSDFFEGRANLQGVYWSFAYSFTDAIIGTVRYGYANRINDQLGTGGSNLDVPGINPIKDYNLVQLDLTWRF